MVGPAAPAPPAAPAASIMPRPGVTLGPAPPAPPPAVPEMRAFGDSLATRNNIYADTLAAARELPPLEDDNYRLSLAEVDWADPERFSRRRRKEAVLTGDTLARRMRGTWELFDKRTGRVVGRRRQVVAAVPYMSSMGTFLHRGNEYTVNHQQRLRAGVFARRKDNGELESHFNILPGKGVSHRYFLDPESSLFKIKLGQAEIPLMPLLSAMGVTDKELRAAWGDQIWAANYARNDAGALRKVAQRLLREKDYAGLSEGDATRKLVERLTSFELDPEVTKRTLGRPFDRVTKEAVLAATAKLIRVNKKEEQPDDRDHLAYQQFMGPEDLFAERLRRDHGYLRRQLFRKVAKAGSLDAMPSGALTKQLEQVLVGSGLAQALEEINPAEVFDKQGRITRLGEGGIPSVDSIPDEARSVQPSHMGFMDPIRTPESFRVGVDLNMARASRKGRDGRIYTQVRDKAGNLAWKTPQDLADAAIVTPEVLADPFWKDMKRVPVMQGGRLEYLTRDRIDYTLPDFSAAFSPLANLVPFMAATKPGRVAMGSRYMTQALPVTNAEAPFVQSGLPGQPGKSYESEYGKHMGAVRAEKAGRVVDVHGGVVKVKYADGTTDEVELYDHHPFNRKTFVHQTPLVKPGDALAPGQLIARSNYTDDTGATALGLNLRVAYFPYKGLNFEDAQVISESAAKRLTSEHMYQHDLEVTPRHKTGLKPYVALFPGKYDRATLAKLDDRGVIRVGEAVEYGQPLVLAAKERDRALNKIHKKRQPGYADDSVVWKHHDPGVVTDVVWGKNGPVVLVKSASAAQVGDKLSGRYGDKGVIAAIVPDDQMPHDRDGQPFEVLLSPDGIITRTNPSQEIEAALGKIAAKTGKPVVVPDFDTVADLQDWADKELKRHGLTGTEDVVWPEKGVRVPGVGTGYRFLMKLHHTAECFDAETEALTRRGWVPWPEVRDDDELATRDTDGRLVFQAPLEVTREPYVGELYCFSGRYVDYAVTPNHRFWVRGPSAFSAFEFRRADSLHGRRFGVPQFGMPQNVDFTCDAAADTFITVAGVQMTAGDYAELVGWWATEGYARVTPRRAYTVLYQSRDANPGKFADIEALARRLGLPWSVYRVNGRDSGVVISSRPLASHLKACGTHSHNKRLPRDLMSHAPSTLRRCYDAMLAGDGNTQQTDAGPRSRYTTVSKGLADDFQELCVRMGSGAVVRPTKRRATMTINLPDGRSYVSACRPVWECGVALSRTVAQVDGDRNRAGFSTRAYSGVVYCATMKTGLLYVRRNGKPMLSGNSKGQGRDSGAYSSDETPAKGGETGSKRLALLDVNALLSHGATETLRDAGAYRGQKNEDLAMDFISGLTMGKPRVPKVYEQFVNSLKASGINVVPDGPRTHFMALTNRDVDTLAGDREVRSGDTVHFDRDLKPVKGGLFDEHLTGGHSGKKWAFIRLPEPLPNPVMEEPIRRVLGLTGKQFEAVLAGEHQVAGFGTGPRAIAKALDNLDLDKELDAVRAQYHSGKASARDAAVRKWGYLKSAKRLGLHPGDWVLSKAPVLPPTFRPVSVMGDSGIPLVADANYLYKELLEAKKNYADLKDQVGEDALGPERLAVYHAFKAVTGLGDPVHPKLVEKGVRGILKGVFGTSPKFGTVQRKLISSTVDSVGRAVITPNPDFDMDTVGVPEKQAFEVYRKAVVRRLRRRGMSVRDALHHVREKTPLARDVLVDEMEHRPVYINRAPVLHRFGIMAFRPKLVSGDVLQVSPLIVGGFNADFDGDAMQFHVPMTDEAVKEAYDRLLPSRSLLSPADFKSPVHKPGQQYLAGLYHATRQHDRPKGRPRRARVFRRAADALAAYARGEVRADDDVDVLE